MIHFGFDRITWTYYLNRDIIYGKINTIIATLPTTTNNILPGIRGCTLDEFTNGGKDGGKIETTGGGGGGYNVIELPSVIISEIRLAVAWSDTIEERLSIFKVSLYAIQMNK